MVCRSYLRLSGVALLGIGGLIEESQATPSFSSKQVYKRDELRKELEEIKRDCIYTRENTIISYEEWKSDKEAEATEKNHSRKPRTILMIKADMIAKNPRRAFSFLTEEEKRNYPLHFNLMDPIIDCILINKKYNLDFSPEEFKDNEGAKLIWFLDIYHSFRHSDEEAKDKIKRE